SGDFSVTSVRKIIDDKSLSDVDSKTRWIKYVPIKVNVHAWKVKTDSLPTRFNVSCRGIDIDSSMCAICDNGMETSRHLFFYYCMVRQIVRKITRWWDVPYVEVESYEDWYRCNASFSWLAAPHEPSNIWLKIVLVAYHKNSKKVIMYLGNLGYDGVTGFGSDVVMIRVCGSFIIVVSGVVLAGVVNDKKHGKWTNITKKYRFFQEFTALVPSCFVIFDLEPLSLSFDFIQRISLTGFPAQSVGSSNTDVLDLPCLLVLITGSFKSRVKHVDTSSIHIESRKSPTAVLFDDDTGRISIRHCEY
ncbi:RNA-directed DNA polymerase, eukaryota, partial [Tanacetum coccineum]